MRKVVCLLLPKVHLLDLAGPMHIFYESKYYGGKYNLIYCTIGNGEENLMSSSGLIFTQLQRFQELNLSAQDLIIVPGASFDELEKCTPDNHQDFFDWLVQQSASGVAICSVCTGAYLLGVCGLLDGKQYTTHWRFHTIFQKRFPKAQLSLDRFFIANDQLITSAGVSSGIDLALYLLEKTLWNAHGNRCSAGGSNLSPSWGG